MELGARLDKLCLLAAAHVGNVAVEGGNLVGDALKCVADDHRIEEPVPQRAKEDALELRPADRQAVAANRTASAQTAVVAAALAADNRDGLLAARAAEHAIEEVVRVHLGTRALTGTEAAALAAGPDRLDLLAPRLHGIPEGLRNDPKALINENEMLRLGLDVGTATARTIAPGTGTVPGPPADVLRIRKDAIEGGRPPAGTAGLRRKNALLIQLSNKPVDGKATGEVIVDTADDGGLVRLNPHLVAFGPRSAPLVDTDIAVGVRAKAVRALADVEAALLLAKLATVGPLPKIREQQLVDRTAHLNQEGGFLVRRVKMVAHGDQTDALVLKVREHRQHVRVVSSEARQVINEHNVEEALTSRIEQSAKLGPFEKSAGLRIVRVDVIIKHHEAHLHRGATTRGDLVLDALLPLILRAVPGIDRGDGHEASFDEPGDGTSAAP